VDYEAYGLGVEIVNLPKLFMAIPDSEKHWITADSSRPETISHLRQHGFSNIQSAIKGARSLEEGIEFLKGYDIIVHPRCQHLIDELTLYSYKIDRLTGQVTSVLEDKDNHCIDAMRYAVEGARRALKGMNKVVNMTVPKMVTPFARR
jgi:phage terminase large subunit